MTKDRDHSVDLWRSDVVTHASQDAVVTYDGGNVSCVQLERTVGKLRCPKNMHAVFQQHLNELLLLGQERFHVRRI
jgi:hypothetical protein